MHSWHWDALRDFVIFVQFKKSEKHPCRRVTFSKVTIITLLHVCFLRFLNCANRAKYHIRNQLTFKRQPHKMVKHTQTTCRQQPTNCLSVFDHFVGLALEGLRKQEFLVFPFHLF